MVRIQKFVVGIRPQDKMFRVSSYGGAIVDAVLAARTEKALGESYFTEVSTAVDHTGRILSNEELGNTLKIEDSNIIFVKDYYGSERKFSAKEVLAEWRFLWKVVNDILMVRNIRRIGIAAEHQFEATSGTPSNALHSSLIAGPHPMHAGRFNLQFEDRRPTTSKSGLPDAKKDAFINVIHQYYAAELDSERPANGYINANIDVQKYYAPPFTGNIFDEVAEVLRIFEKEKAAFDANLKQRGFV